MKDIYYRPHDGIACHVFCPYRAYKHFYHRQAVRVPHRLPPLPRTANVPVAPYRA